jgi:nitrite reductase/ring-hydroxylating ferredoxin subunit
MADFHNVAASDSLKPGQGRTVEFKGRRFALFNIDGEFYAIDDECPHVGAPLGAGFVENGKVYCPMHGWCFDPKTGASLTNPARPISAYPTRVENGEVQIQF